MSTTRNQSPVLFGGIKIQPATTRVPSQQSPTQNIFMTGQSLASNPIMPAMNTSANFNNMLVNNTANLNIGIAAVPAPSVAPILSPLIVLTGTKYPFIAPQIIFTPKPNPIKLLTDKDLQEETLVLDTYNFLNGQAILDISDLRCEILSLMSFRSIYDSTGAINNFGEYFYDIYQSSILRDSLRKYLLVNGAGRSPELGAALGRVSEKISTDLENTKNVISFLDSLIVKIKNINNVLDVKKNLSEAYIFTNPNKSIREFVTNNMLFSEQSYNIFSDTKIVYQLLFDLGGILDKCSFNLLSGFTDHERSTNIKNPSTVRQQNVQDSITIDLSYGDNLNYTSKSIKAKYITNSVAFNSVLNALPPLSTNRFKFIVNLLSKEMRISKGLGKYRLSEANYFGFRDQGNPFDNIIGSIPKDIFMQPAGVNSLSTLFYISTTNQNVVILPFENRQVIGDNETVFVPGSTYFSDGILKNDFSAYNSYRELFSRRITNTKNVMDYLLLRQAENDKTSQGLTQISILDSSLSLYKSSQDFIRSINYESTSILTFVMLLSGNANQKIKFEVFKLLLLITLHDGRKDVNQNEMRTDRFRDLLFGEISQQSLQGFTESITESNLAKTLEVQIGVVKNLLAGSIVKTKASIEEAKSLQVFNTKIADIANQKTQLGKELPKNTAANSNPNKNSILVPMQQLMQISNCLRGEQNLFKNIIDIAKNLFLAGSDNESLYYITDNSSLTRYGGVSITTFILLAFEMFSTLAEQFAKPYVTYNLIDGIGAKNVDSQQIRVSYAIDGLTKTSNDIKQSQIRGRYDNDIIADYYQKLTQEDQIIKNIILFFDRLNQQLSNPIGPTVNESLVLSSVATPSPNSISTTRTAKSILSYINNKISLYNPGNNPNLNFYLPSGKIISDNNYHALVNSLESGKFLSGRKKLVTVGIPSGFVNSALSARLSKNDVYNGNLKQETSDLVKIQIYKLAKNDEAIIYNPQTFKFDLSLFAKGFDAYNIGSVKNSSYNELLKMFQFYDFDEDLPYSQVHAKNIESFTEIDNYYNVSLDRKRLCEEVAGNLFDSFILDLYTHLLTGLNTSEETFIKYNQNEINGFMGELNKTASGTADYSKVKLMSPEYKKVLDLFKSNPDDLKLMLTLCNDIPSSVFREKEYDRTYTIMFDVDRFPLDINSMNQTPQGRETLGLLWSMNKIYNDSGEVYKRPDDFLMDQYFINVELIQ